MGFDRCLVLSQPFLDQPHILPGKGRFVEDVWRVAAEGAVLRADPSGRAANQGARAEDAIR